MIFLCYPKCTTCQKAKRFLDEKGISYEERNIKEQNPKREELRDWQQKSELPTKKFFNTSGLLYRQQNLARKLPLLNEEEQLSLLASDGMLVKRPILITKTAVLVGFASEEWEKELG